MFGIAFKNYRSCLSCIDAVVESHKYALLILQCGCDVLNLGLQKQKLFLVATAKGIFTNRNSLLETSVSKQQESNKFDDLQVAEVHSNTLMLGGSDLRISDLTWHLEAVDQ